MGMKLLVVFSVLAVSVQSAPQLLYGGYAGYPYAGHAVHAVPTVAKHTVNYKTAAFEPVDAATPADAQLIELTVLDAYGYAGLGFPWTLPVAAPAAAEAA